MLGGARDARRALRRRRGLPPAARRADRATRERRRPICAAAGCASDRRARDLRADRVRQERRRGGDRATAFPPGSISADSAQLYRGLPILTNQSPGGRSSRSGTSTTRRRSPSTRRSRTRRSTRRSPPAERPVVVGGTGLYFRAALGRARRPAGARAGARERWEACLRPRGAEAAHALLAERDPDAAAAVHPNDRRRVVRALELAEAGHSLARRPAVGRRTRVTRRSWSGSTSRSTSSTGGSRSGRGRCSTPASSEEVRRALAGPLSSTAAEDPGPARGRRAAPRGGGGRRWSARTRRFAAYQRKWMRRIPGLVSVRADRSPDEVADEILALARGGQRVPAGRAG